jgi:lysine biosynthesis protein LysW
MGDELSRIECPECGKGFDIEEAPFGQSVLCPYCGAEFDA